MFDGFRLGEPYGGFVVRGFTEFFSSLVSLSLSLSLTHTHTQQKLKKGKRLYRVIREKLGRNAFQWPVALIRPSCVVSLDFTEFYWVLLGFYLVLLGFT